jgi:hypothetical protein
MTFKELLNSPVFFSTFLKNETFFNSIRDKFPDILGDLTSSRDNPNCSCKGRVRGFLQSRIQNDNNYFNELLNNQEVKDLIIEKQQEIRSTQQPIASQMNAQQFAANSARVFQIGKTDEDWKRLSERLFNEKLMFRSFSIIEKPDKLIVYFI